MRSVHHRGLIELFSGSAISLWGIRLIQTTSLERVVSLARDRLIAPEVFWGLLFFIAGATLILGALLHRRWLLFAGASLTLFARLFVLILVGVQGGFASVVVSDFAIWALMSIYCLVRAFRNES